MIYTLKKYAFLSVFFVLLGIQNTWSQYDIPEKPPKEQQTSVYDEIGLLTPSQKKALEQKLLRYSDSTSTQIVVIIISSTKGEDISLLGAKWGQKWGIGQKNKDNGILILLAKDDRKIDINTGYGIEYRITDLMAERIINRIIIPEFKKGNFYAGLDKGTDAIFKALKGEFTEDRDFKNNEEFNWFPIIVFLIFVLLIIFRNRNGGGGSGTLADIIILSNMGRSSSYGGSSGGGSFGGGGFGGGFGGGGFGGGGASGGW